MRGIIDLLVSSPLLLLFLTVGLGSLLGTVRVAGFSLGPAAVLFTGLFLGAFDARLRIPDPIYVLGLIIFVYTIGLQSGPTFFASFGKRALRANMVAVASIGLGAFLSALVGHILRLEAGTVAGICCGGLTNTPALAASVEMLRRAAPEAMPAEALSQLVNAPVIGYSVAYPFGVIGVLLSFYLFSKTRPGGEAAGERAEASSILLAQTFRVTNPAAIGRSVAQLFAEQGNPGIVLSRLRRGSTTTLVYGETALAKDDLVVAVGNPEALAGARALLGEEATQEIQSENREFDFRRIEVSDKRVVGRKVRDLRLQELLDATITRIRRGDVDFVPTGDTILERGDRVRVLTWAGNIERLVRFFGDSVRSSSETDLLSLSAGLVAGVILGMIPIPIPGGTTFTLGFAGGPLIAGLLLGRLQRTGEVVWGMPFGVNQTLRQVGLVLFLAGVGTRAGGGFVHTLVDGGWRLMAAGAVVTAVVTCSVLLLGLRTLRLSLPAAMGLMSGIQTQPACLAYANEHATSNAPNVWYASVYPASMIAKIILAQLLVAAVV